MGGLIASYLANRFPVRHLVLLNTAIIYLSPARFIKSTVEQVMQKDWSRFSSMRQTPLTRTRQFIQLVRLLKPEIKKIKTPSLIIQSKQDQVIHPYSAQYMYRHIKGVQKKLILFEKSKHLICLDEESDEVFKSVLIFINIYSD